MSTAIATIAWAGACVILLGWFVSNHGGLQKLGDLWRGESLEDRRKREAAEDVAAMFKDRT